MSFHFKLAQTKHQTKNDTDLNEDSVGERERVTPCTTNPRPH